MRENLEHAGPPVAGVVYGMQKLSNGIVASADTASIPARTRCAPIADLEQEHLLGRDRQIADEFAVLPEVPQGDTDSGLHVERRGNGRQQESARHLAGYFRGCGDPEARSIKSAIAGYTLST